MLLVFLNQSVNSVNPLEHASRFLTCPIGVGCGAQPISVGRGAQPISEQRRGTRCCLASWTASATTTRCTGTRSIASSSPSCRSGSTFTAARCVGYIRSTLCARERDTSVMARRKRDADVTRLGAARRKRDTDVTRLGRARRKRDADVTRLGAAQVPTVLEEWIAKGEEEGGVEPSEFAKALVKEIGVLQRVCASPTRPPLDPILTPLDTEIAPGNPGCSQRW
eukprot:1196070-Prorocentrum_minimum.AAC.1